MSKKPDVGTVESLVFQFETALGQIAEVTASIPAEEWKRGHRPHLVPVRQVCHMIGGCEMMVCRGSGKRFTWSQRFNGLVGMFGRRYEAGELPDKGEVLEYLAETRRAVRTWLGGLAAGWPARPRRVNKGRYSSNLGWVLYILRHTVVHLGYLRSELRGRGISLPAFR